MGRGGSEQAAVLASHECVVIGAGPAGLGTAAMLTDHGVDVMVAERGEAVATRKYHTPVVPAWPGADSFSGEIVHSSAYRNAEPYRGRHVLVVGPGASGFEIALQLAEGGAASVRLAVRTPPHIIHRNIGPFPSDLFAVLARRLPPAFVDRTGEAIRRISIGDLSGYGLNRPPDGIYSRLLRTGMIPTVNGPYVAAVKQDLIEV